MKPTFSLVVNHAPWKPERVQAKGCMLLELLPLSRRVPFFLHDTDYRGRDWQDDGKVAWALAQWRWSAKQATTHHVFLTDDLALAPRWWEVLGAMVEAAPASPIGLLSNHPRAPDLIVEGWKWYATNSWLVGPAYVLPHELLVAFLAWFEALPDGPHTVKGTKAYANDDSSINEWITVHGPGRTLHPLPTIIEHRTDLESTVGHGDEYSRERVSWRRVGFLDEHEFVLTHEQQLDDVEQMAHAEWWNEKGGAQAAPLLLLPSNGG